MAIFKDATGDEWNVNLNVPVMKTVKEQTGYHLGFLLKDGMKLLSEITSDPIIFADVFRAMCSDQIKQRGITDNEFFLRLDGDAATSAVESLWKAIEDFYPSQIRQAMRDLASKADQVRDLAMKQIEQSVSEFQKVEPGAILTAIFSQTATGSQAS